MNLCVCLQPILAPGRATDYFAITSHLEPKNVLRRKGSILLSHPITIFCFLCFCLQCLFTSSCLFPLPVLKSSLPIKADFHIQLFYTINLNILDKNASDSKERVGQVRNIFKKMFCGGSFSLIQPFLAYSSSFCSMNEVFHQLVVNKENMTGRYIILTRF